ncbi:MAG TPA: hypothetical protein VHW71_16815 [Steroidobacteraceae bacterium]|jgi:hypothetical protein|nr:hypothetical protein [Steroidobacteraceae bacterium]
MAAYIRIAGMIFAATLCGCASTGGHGAAKPATATAMSKDPTCLTDTGSRIAAAPSRCRGVGRSYSSDDIDRTGSTSAGDALKLLDSSVTVHH